MQRIEAIDEYNRAQRLGMRDYREKTAAGKYPYLPALDELLEKTDTESQIPLGTIEIPLDYVVGTKTTGRTMAFASNFMPLLPEDTEFASKWLSLCMAHMEEGIHDAIKAYEYMGRFYVQEGNKRVSVLKYFGADSIFATVTRVVPRFNDTPEIREYYEFMEYYPLCGLYRLHFTQEGSFARLQKALGKAPDEKWTADDKAEVVSLMNWITKAYNAHGGDKMRTTPADVMLLLLRLYKLDELKTYSPAQFAAAIDAVWDNVLALERPEPVKLSTQPAAPAKKNSLLDRILPGKCPCGRTHIRIDRIKGRSDDMFIIKGVNIFPMQVEKVLVQFPELGSNYLITLETVNNQDEMIVEVELSDLSTDNYIELQKISKAITRQLKDEILVTPKLRLVKKGSLPQSEGKAVRVKDLRDNK
jgi:hypothetical protein